MSGVINALPSSASSADVSHLVRGSFRGKLWAEEFQHLDPLVDSLGILQGKMEALVNRQEAVLGSLQEFMYTSCTSDAELAASPLFNSDSQDLLAALPAAGEPGGRAEPKSEKSEKYGVNCASGAKTEDTTTERCSAEVKAQFALPGDLVTRQSTDVSTFSERERRLKAQAKDSIILKHLASGLSQVNSHLPDSPKLRRVARLRIKLASAVKSRYFDAFFGILIVVNTLVMGIQVQMTAYRQDVVGISLGQHAFTLAFLVELLIRLTAFGVNFFCMDDWLWNIFDLVLVMTSLFECYVDIASAIGEPSEEAMNSMLYLRLFRIIRIMARVSKLMRVLRLSRWVQPFRVLLLSFMSTIQSMFWIIICFGMLIFVFSILFTTAAVEHLQENPDSMLDAQKSELWNSYGTLDRSALTLYMATTGGMDWQEPMLTIGFIDLWWELAFLAMQFFNYFAVLNLITGVFCQCAIESAMTDQHTVIDERMKKVRNEMKAVRGLFAAIDTDNDGTLTLEELARHLEDPYIMAFFKAIDIDSSDAWKLFGILDKDGSHFITLDEFCDGCLSLRGPARAPDMFKVGHEIKYIRTQLRALRQQVKESQAISHSHLRRQDVSNRAVPRFLHAGSAAFAARMDLQPRAANKSLFMSPQDSGQQQSLKKANSERSFSDGSLKKEL